MINFTTKDFSKIEKHVVTVGDNFDSDRFISIGVDDTEIGLCMDERNNNIMLCTVDGEGMDSTNKLIGKICLEQVIVDAATATYSDKEERQYLFYLEEIRPNTECPEIDDSIIVFKPIECRNIESNSLMGVLIS